MSSLDKAAYCFGEGDGIGHKSRYNTFVGHEVAYKVTEGKCNTYLGYHAGCANPLGDTNIMIGNKAGYNLTAGTNNIGIGSELVMPSATGSCQLAIGNDSNYWITGDSSYNIKPGRGITDCDGNTGTSGHGS